MSKGNDVTTEVKKKSTEMYCVLQCWDLSGGGWKKGGRHWRTGMGKITQIKYQQEEEPNSFIKKKNRTS